jgi:hypothetical protein
MANITNPGEGLLSLSSSGVVKIPRSSIFACGEIELLDAALHFPRQRVSSPHIVYKLGDR